MARRLAPGGVLIVDPASGKVENEEIAGRIEAERSADRKALEYPRLQDVPDPGARLLAEAEQLKEATKFIRERDALSKSASRDRRDTRDLPAIARQATAERVDAATSGQDELRALGAALLRSGAADIAVAATLFEGVFDGAPDPSAIDAYFPPEENASDGADEDDETNDRTNG